MLFWFWLELVWIYFRLVKKSLEKLLGMCHLIYFILFYFCFNSKNSSRIAQAGFWELQSTGPRLNLHFAHLDQSLPLRLPGSLAPVLPINVWKQEAAAVLSESSNSLGKTFPKELQLPESIAAASFCITDFKKIFLKQNIWIEHTEEHVVHHLYWSLIRSRADQCLSWSLLLNFIFTIKMDMYLKK